MLAWCIVATFLIGLAAWYAFLERIDRSQTTERAYPGATAPHELTSDDGGLGRINATRAEMRPSEPSYPRTLVVGRVVSNVGGLPVAAHVEANGFGTWTDTTTGIFRLPVHAAPTLVRVEALGYQPAEVSSASMGVPVVDIGVIRLSCCGTTCVQVHDSYSRPVHDCQLELLAPAGTQPQDTPARITLGRTAADGKWLGEIPGGGFVYAISNGRCAVSHVVVPEQPLITLTLDADCTPGIGMRRQLDGTPLVNAQFRIERLDSYPRPYFMSTTNDAGWIAVDLPRGSYRIESTSPRVRFVAASSWPSDGSTSLSTIVSLPALDSPLWLDIALLPRRCIVVRDGLTRTPLERGCAWIQQQRPRDGKWVASSVPSAEQLVDGAIELPIASNAMLQGEPPTRAVVYAPGYTLRFVETPYSAVPSDGTLDIYMDRAPMQSVRLLNCSGTPYAGHFVFVDSASGAVLSSAADTSPGSTSFAIVGSDVLVRESPSPGSQTLALIPFVQLDATNTAIVTVNACGSIRATCPILPVESLHCLSANGECRTGCIVDDSILFLDLPAGRYLVGTLDQIRMAPLLQRWGTDPYSAIVASGRETRIDCQPAWSATTMVMGRIDCRGLDVSELCVLPLHEPLTVPISGGPHRRFPVARDGSFGVQLRGSLPPRLGVAVIDSLGDERILRVVNVDDAHQIELAVGTVRCTGDASLNGRNISVSYRIPGINLVGGDVRRDAVFRSMLEFDQIPTTVTDITVHVDNWTSKFSVVLAPDRSFSIHLAAR